MNQNLAIITGRLGADPEIRTFDSGKKVASLRVATSRSYKVNEEWVEQTEWHSVTVFGARAEVLEKYCKKGFLVSVQGRISTRSYDKDGVTRYVTEIIADRIDFAETVSRERAVSAAPQPAAKPEGEADDDSPF